jgi:hypothetical protein
MTKACWIKFRCKNYGSTEIHVGTTLSSMKQFNGKTMLKQVYKHEGWTLSRYEITHWQDKTMQRSPQAHFMVVSCYWQLYQ